MTPDQFYHDRNRHVLVYSLPEQTALAVGNHVAAAVSLSATTVAVPITLYNLQLLRWLGLPVVPLMNYDYDWPHGPQIEMPFRAQIITANFLVVHPRAFCLSDMRTGKTLSLLWAADRVMREHAPGTCRALITAPLGILHDVWAVNIFQHFLGRRTCAILHGTPKQRLEALREPHDFYIINYDGLGTDAKVDLKGGIILDGFSKELAARADIRISILDECSAYRTGNTKRHRVARQVIMQRPYFWAASGTPTPNGPQNAHGQARLVNGAFGESYRSYRNRVMYQLGPHKWVPKRGAQTEALKLLSPAVRFKMEDCADMPPKLPPQVISVEMSARQKKDYAELRRSALLMVEGGVITAANEAVLRSKLIQVACGAVYETRGDDRVTHKLDCGPRLNAMYEVIEQAGAKIIIFAPLTSVLSMLYDELSKDVKIEGVRQPQYKVAVINGSVSPTKRAEILQAFRDPEGLDIILADPGTMAHGIDLSNSKVILWFALPEKTEQYLQANERIRGARQKYPTLVAHLVATAAEREIYRRLEANESLQGSILALIKGENNVVHGRGFSAMPPRA